MAVKCVMEIQVGVQRQKEFRGEKSAEVKGVQRYKGVQK